MDAMKIDAYAETAELVFRNYVKSLDLTIAMRRAGCTDEEAEELKSDEEFMARIELVDFDVQEELITSLRELCQSPNENVKLSATLKLGEMVYKSRFKQKLDGGSDVRVPDKIVLKGSDE